jgi:hypothetical protein
MPKLAVPQYISQARPQGVVRPANIPGAVDVSGLVQGVSNASSIVSNQAARDANEAERIKAQQEHEARQLAEGEAKVAVANAVSEAQSNWTERLTTAMQSAPADAPNFTANTLKEFDAFAEQAVAKVPELGQQAMRERLAGIRNQIHGRAFQFETDARNAKIGGDYNSGLELDRNTVSADPSQYNQRLANRLSLLQGLGLGAETTAKMAEATRHDMAKSAAEGMVSRSPETFLKRTGMAGGKTGKDGQPLPTDPAKAAEAVQNDPVLRNLKPEVLTSLVERATMLSITRQNQIAAEQERARARAEAAANNAFREATTAFTVMDGALSAGRKIDMTNPQNRLLIEQINRVPAYKAAFAANLEYAQKNTAVAMLPIPQQEAALNALYAQRNVNGTSPGLEKEIARVEKVASESKSAYKAEPLKAAADYGLIPAVVPLDVTNMDATLQGLKARSQQAMTAGNQAGRAVSPFTAAEADKVSAQLLTLPADQQGTRIAQLTSQMTPPQAQAFALQIDPKARALSLAMQAGSSMTDEGRTVSGLILRGQQAIKDKAIKEDTSAEFGVRASIAKQVGDTVSGPAREAVIDSARYIYLGKQAAGERVSFEGVVNLTMGGPIVEHNGARLPVPAGVDLPEVLAKYPASKLPATVYVNGKAITAEAAVRTLPGAQLESAGNGRYRVRVGGYLVGDEQRRPVLIDVR